jgi:hypothetical protein
MVRRIVIVIVSVKENERVILVEVVLQRPWLVRRVALFQ